MRALKTGVMAVMALLGASGARADEPPIAFRHFWANIAVNEDGTYVADINYEIASTNEGGAKNIAVQYANYVDALETLELKDAYTVKPDGRRIPVAPGAIRTQLAPGSSGL